MLVDFEYVGQGEPPDYEFVGLVNTKDWKAKETLEQAVNRKNRFKKEIPNHNPYWNPLAKQDWLESEEFIKKLQNT